MKQRSRIVWIAWALLLAGLAGRSLCAQEPRVAPAIPLEWLPPPEPESPASVSASVLPAFAPAGRGVVTLCAVAGSPPLPAPAEAEFVSPAMVPLASPPASTPMAFSFDARSVPGSVRINPYTGYVDDSLPPPALTRQIDASTWCSLGILARSYYSNDQRIEWSGMESTFGVEGILSPIVRHDAGCWDITTAGEFYLNQPFDGNKLMNTPELRSYQANFQTDTVEISQLWISAQRGAWDVKAGKFVTPFGRTWFPLYTNSRLDAPFIRTEAIQWRETGLLVSYRPGHWTLDVAMTNGGEDQDTNSSKAVVARAGWESDWGCFGVSAKQQDGTGSDAQKEYDNYFGFDAMIQGKSWRLSGEAIYDEYGFRQPGFDPLDITWQKSIYYRDENLAPGVPLTGFGYYVNLDYFRAPWTFTLNYGEFYPRTDGDPRQDEVNRRGIFKLAHRFGARASVYGMLLKENGGYIAQADRPRIGDAVLLGFDFGM